MKAVRSDPSSVEPILLTEATLDHVMESFLPEEPEGAMAARPRANVAQPIEDLFASETAEKEHLDLPIRASDEAERPWRTYSWASDTLTADAVGEPSSAVSVPVPGRSIRRWTMAAAVVIGLAAIASIAMQLRFTRTPTTLEADGRPAASSSRSPNPTARAPESAAARSVDGVVATGPKGNREAHAKTIPPTVAGTVLKGSLTPNASPRHAVEPRTPAPRAVLPVTPPNETPAVPEPSRPSVATPPDGAPEPLRAPPVEPAPAPPAAPAVRDPAPAPREVLPALSSSVPPAVPTAATDTARIEAVLSRYRHAFTALDANAARAVWPTVDARALGRAFDQLVEQQLDFQNCSIVVDTARATAACGGRARYVPKVGSRSVHDEPRQWTFSLEKANGQWLIERVASR
jgi:hypothetical protein